MTGAEQAAKRRGWIPAVALELRLAVFRHLHRLSARFYDRTPTGRLVGRVTTDVEALQELFSSGVVTILGDLVFLVATLTILLSLDASLTAVTMLTVLASVVLHGASAWPGVRAYGGWAEEMADEPDQPEMQPVTEMPLRLRHHEALDP